MLPDDKGGGLPHGCFIKRVRVVGDVAGEKGRHDITAPEAVLIALGPGGVAGVEVFGHLANVKDADGGGKTVIENDAEVGGRNLAGGLEGCDLRESVNSSICASRSLGQESLTSEALNDRGEGALDGGASGLDLPSMEGATVIGEGKFESSSHGLQGIADFKSSGFAWQGH